MRILFEDRDIIVIVKEAGEASQSSSASSADIVSMLKNHISKETGKKGDIYVGVVHRLDQPVSGILVFAKNKEAAAVLSKQASTDIMNKIYNATVSGLFGEGEKQEKSLTLINFMYKDSKNNKGEILNKNDKEIEAFKKANPSLKVKKAELSLEIMSEDVQREESHVKIKLKTGRFHQIRAQLSNIGHPIVGDKKYGYDKERSGKGIELSAVSLEFIHPRSKEKMSFSIE